ncbi:unnamed protein product [Cylindrotheca closterium]|uniref:PH domain-containing protein n=1 Tax=Cylindrotheca closterium TaxID=2856 RepID=A0AAD2FYM5_9STRA|nr:unnamed protein product [Cylindrotheca closterium]
MEKYVLGYFREQLSKIIIGFREEQVNANLLNGKGEIRDLQINCSVVNKMVSQLVPFATFEEVHVSRLGFQVTSWANLRKAPIVVDIGCITAVVEEPLNYVTGMKKTGIRMFTEKELARMIEEELLKPFRKTGAYGIVDRITDNLTIEIEKIDISFSTMGRFKTKRIGPWTPPVLHIECRNFRSTAVDIHGHEGTPEQIWAHNHRRNQAFLLCRKVALETCVSLKSPEKEITLIKGLKLEVQIALRQRLRDGHILGIQSDVTIPSVDVVLDQENLPMVASLMAGLQYCVTKDRSYEDPLHSKSAQGGSALASVIASSRNSNPEAKTATAEEVASNFTPEIDDDNISEGSSSSSEGDEGVASDAAQSSAESTNTSKLDVLERPVLVLPLGIIIHQDVCITASIHQAVIRGSYAGEEDGCVQLTAQGTIAELIWPKANSEFGFHAQASVAYCTLEEAYGNQRTTLFINGIARKDHSSMGNKQTNAEEISFDENFPFFEKRSIRNDPLDLRRTFPSQGVGQKLTVDFLNKDLANPKVFNETGINQVEIILDLQPWWRVTRFVLNEPSGGYDPRLHSGDWSDVLTVDMLQDPTKPIDLDDQLQFTKQKFLGDDYMLSSDVFSAVVRLTNITIRCPAAIKESVRACDLLLELEEVTVTVTSDLPRSFLTGKLSNWEKEDETNNKKVEFPNDHSDILFHIESEQDSLLAHQASSNSKISSTFRQQITVRGFQMRIIPVVPFCNASDPQQLFAPTDVTLIASLEGGSPSVDDEAAKLVFYLSIHVHKAFLNLDLDLIAGMTSTLLYHGDTVIDALKHVKDMGSSAKNKTKVRNQKVVKKSMTGRQEMIRRQVLRSKAAAGLSIVVCLQLSEFGLSFWRQNIPLESPVISTDSKESSLSFDASHIAALRLLEIRIENFEVGAEFGFRNEKVSRTVLKCCLERFQVRLCRVRNNLKQNSPTLSSDAQEHHDSMVELLSFGGKPGQDKVLSTPNEDPPIAIRCEELKCNDSKAWSLAAKVTSSAILNLYFDELKDCAALCIEALMMPSWSKRNPRNVGNVIFPPHSLGAFFHSLIPKMQSSGKKTKNLDIDFGSNFEEPAVERMMKKFLEEFLPHLDMILCRCELANFTIQIPIGPSNSKRIGLILNQSDLSMMLCPDPDRLVHEIEEVLSTETSKWRFMMASKASGLHLGFLSRSSLFAHPSTDPNSDVQILVQPCGIDVTYSGGRFDLSMSDNLRIGDIRLLEAQVSHMKEITKNFKDRTLDLSAQLSTLPAWPSAKGKGFDVHAKETKYDGEEETANLRAVRNSRSLLDMLHTELVEYEQRVRDELGKKDLKVALLQKEVFVKERERFSAVSLLASRASGWIRMGGVHLVGQRVTRKATMLPYWMILRKELILLFSAPGELRPLDAVQLGGATIRDLGGAGVKRGFAIVERDNTTRFFVCESAADYTVWISDLSAAILACNGTVDVGGTVDEKGDASGNVEKSLGNMDTVEGEGPGLREKINLSNRLAGAKNKFGSAIQTARQKGRVVSDTARQKSKEMSDRFDGSSKGSLGSTDRFESEDARSTTGNSTTDGEGNEGKGRFSRFGSALQSARQRVRETAEEKQGSLAGLRNKIPVPGRLTKGDNRPTEVEVIHNDSIEIYSWRCRACTYTSNVENAPTVQSTCEMCGSPWQPEEVNDQEASAPAAPSPNDPNASSNHSPLTPVEESQEGNTGANRGDTNRRGFLGIGGGLPKQDGMNLQGRFNFRKKNSDISERYSPITMRDIFARGRAPPLPDHALDWEPLKLFEGRWIVSVTPEPVDSNISKSTTETEPQEVPSDNTSEQNSDLAHKPSSAPGENVRAFFRIKVRQCDKNHKDSSSENLRTLGDILEIYTQVSEDIERIAAQLLQVDTTNGQVSLSDRENVVDKLVVCGMMLGGILDMDEMSNLLNKTRNYQADVLEGFLNSVLECPMPVGTLGSLTEVLGICVSTKDVTLVPSQTESRTESAKDDTVTSTIELGENRKANKEDDMLLSASQLEPEKMLSLISTCGAQMLRAEYNSPRPTKNRPVTQSETEALPVPAVINKFTAFGSPLLPASIQKELQRPLHDALIRIMAERDVSNAQLIGSSVLHAHALENEKRKNRLLELELEVLRRLSQANQPSGNLFGGQLAATVPHKDLEAKVKKLQLENSDDMMIALSQQLGVEIHAKTELEAEIKRMKESDKLKSEVEIAENEALKKELKRVKDLLAAEERSKQSAFMESEKYKASYERLKAEHGEN